MREDGARDSGIADGLHEADDNDIRETGGGD